MTAFDILAAAKSRFASRSNPQGRLTLTSGTAVTSADVAAATSVFYTPHDGDLISLFDGTGWSPVKFPETTLSLSGLAANTNYDVWGRIVSGALALDMTAWTNDTTRTVALAKQDGIDVKSDDPTRRLLGTFRTVAAGQTEDSKTRRFLSNRHNDVPGEMAVFDPTATWPYSAAVWRQANGNVANQLDYVTCVARPVWALVNGAVVSTVSANPVVGIGVDAVPAASQASVTQQASIPASLTSNSFNTQAFYEGTPGIGRHFIPWIEFGAGSGTQTWLGFVQPTVKSGIVGGVSR